MKPGLSHGSHPMSQPIGLPPDETAAVLPRAAAARWLLVGAPNVGKSALFGRLTGAYTTVSNYPGTSVEVTVGVHDLGEESVEVVDTPGMYGFLAVSEEERGGAPGDPRRRRPDTGPGGGRLPISTAPCRSPSSSSPSAARWCSPAT